MPFEEFTITSTGGLNQDENPHAVADNEVIVSLNDQHRGNTRGTRPGVVRPGAGEDYENALSAGNPIQRLFEYRQDFDESRVLIAISEGSSTPAADIFTDDTTELTQDAAVAIQAGQDETVSMDVHNNALIGTCGNAPSTHTFWRYTGSGNVAAVDLTDSGANQIAPKYIKSWRNYVLVNGLTGQELADNNPATTRFADFGSDITVGANWPDGNTIGFSSKAVAGIETYGPSYTTGFGEYQDNAGDYLYILSSRNLFSVLQDPQSDFIVSDAVANGCVHERAFIALGVDAGDAIYVSDKGIHSLRQSQQYGLKDSRFISWKIRPFWKTINRSRIQNTFGAYDHVNGRVMIAMATGSNTFADTILVLDVKGGEPVTADNARWAIWKVAGVNLTDLLMARDSSDNWHMYAGTTTGDVIRFSDETFTDLGSAYSVEWQTPHRSYGSLLQRKGLGDCIITIEPGGDYRPSLTFIFDYGKNVALPRPLKMPSIEGIFTLGASGSLLGGTDVLGGGTTTSDVKVYGAGSGRTISMKFSHSGSNEPFWVSRLDHEVDLLGESTGD